MRVLKWFLYGLISLAALIAFVVLVAWPLPVTMQRVKNTNTQDVPQIMRQAIKASFWDKDRLYNYAARVLIHEPNRRGRLENQLILYARLRVFQPYERVSSFAAMNMYYGRNTSGIVSAVDTYFCKQPAELSIDEAATLVAVAVSPQIYLADEDLLLRRRDDVIDRMHDQGSISDAERDRAKSIPIRFCQ